MMQSILVCWWAQLAFVKICAATELTTEEIVDSGKGPYTVPLKRQRMPLHSANGMVMYKSAYYGRVSLGMPAQVLDVVFDTGSGHLVVPSTMCRSPTCTKHKRYKRRASVTAQDIDGDGSVVQPGQPRDQITVTFGTGEISGVFVNEMVCLGDRDPADPESIQSNMLLQTKEVVKQKSTTLTESEDEEKPVDLPHGCLEVSIVAATDMTEDPFESFAFDGVLGMGLSGLSQTPKFNFFDMTARSTAISPMPGFDRTFSVFLGTSDLEESTITFGGYKPEHIQEGSEFAWSQVENGDDGYWQIKIFGIIANGEKLDFCDDGTCRGIVDTGTSLLAVPSSLGPQIVRKLRHVNVPGYRCNGPGPKLEIDLGNITVELVPRDFARPEFVGNGSAELHENSTCIPMVMHLDLDEPLSKKTLILGEPILQKYHAAFHMDEIAPRVGFAPAMHVMGHDAIV